MDSKFNITPEIMDILREIYPRIMERKTGIIKELKRLWIKYPKAFLELAQLCLVNFRIIR